MRAKDIKEGGEYYTYVSGERVKVRVIHDRGKPGPYQRGRYQVERVDNGKRLSKWRSPQALHPAPTGPWPGMTQKQEMLEEGVELKLVEDLYPGDVIKGRDQDYEVRDAYQDGSFYNVYVKEREKPFKLWKTKLLKVRI